MGGKEDKNRTGDERKEEENRVVIFIVLLVGGSERKLNFQEKENRDIIIRIRHTKKIGSISIFS